MHCPIESSTHLRDGLEKEDVSILCLLERIMFVVVDELVQIFKVLTSDLISSIC